MFKNFQFKMFNLVKFKEAFLIQLSLNEQKNVSYVNVDGERTVYNHTCSTLDTDTT